jgi:uncharacterized membrane protein
MEVLVKYFSWLCGQATDRSWLFGSEMFPLCERCTGIYAGAAIAMALFLWNRPRPSRTSLVAYGSLILQIIPAGLHWWFDTPALRTLSGAWFGIGLVGLLYHQPAIHYFSHAEKKKSPVVPMTFLLVTGLVPLIERGDVVTGKVCADLVFLGLISIGGLIALNTCRMVEGLKLSAVPKTPFRRGPAER